MAHSLAGGSFARQKFLRSAGPFVVSETRHPTGFSAPDHVHERPSINVVLAGGYAESGRGKSEVWPMGSVIAKPAWSSHSNHFRGTGAHCLLLEVHAGELDLVRRATDLFAVPVARDGRCVQSCVRGVQLELRRRDCATALALETLGYELVGALTRSARLSDERRPDAWLSRVREMIESLEPDQLSLRVLAREVNRHPAHLARAFKRRHGLSVGQYVRQRQLAAAAQRLRSTRTAVSKIAATAGFYDHSQFCREFRRMTGMTPTAYREA